MVMMSQSASSQHSWGSVREDAVVDAIAAAATIAKTGHWWLYLQRDSTIQIELDVRSPC